MPNWACDALWFLSVPAGATLSMHVLTVAEDRPEAFPAGWIRAAKAGPAPCGTLWHPVAPAADPMWLHCATSPCLCLFGCGQRNSTPTRLWGASASFLLGLPPVTACRVIAITRSATCKNGCRGWNHTYREKCIISARLNADS
ncbi:uncharacterized protein CANTADRAFT_225620 [Suhomyces tanzawaensis NRRL Y-17324]|uniref:Secreted protein n=1 Tax=Suhomyces tanzawaensis NRRL Y-17324 TaxID=984487 RepID=A0A1E4SKM0_9ASCO|nr:uncharacterized protein CANTADRAFT_225620 [Suhomyces tanzawaensis NRRL Y-17324]ODV80043.1 hypothetical protein CANTADRAFT_225620 [Suhomyces tanzawaensis NRRL Y-17324]